MLSNIILINVVNSRIAKEPREPSTFNKETTKLSHFTFTLNMRVQEIVKLALASTMFRKV